MNENGSIIYIVRHKVTVVFIAVPVMGVCFGCVIVVVCVVKKKKKKKKLEEDFGSVSSFVATAGEKVPPFGDEIVVVAEGSEKGKKVKSQRKGLSATVHPSPVAEETRFQSEDNMVNEVLENTGSQKVFESGQGPPARKRLMDATGVKNETIQMNRMDVQLEDVKDVEDAITSPQRATVDVLTNTGEGNECAPERHDSVHTTHLSEEDFAEIARLQRGAENNADILRRLKGVLNKVLREEVEREKRARLWEQAGAEQQPETLTRKELVESQKAVDLLLDSLCAEPSREKPKMQRDNDTDGEARAEPEETHTQGSSTLDATTPTSSPKEVEEEEIVCNRNLCRAYILWLVRCKEVCKCGAFKDNPFLKDFKLIEKKLVDNADQYVKVEEPENEHRELGFRVDVLGDSCSFLDAEFKNNAQRNQKFQHGKWAEACAQGDHCEKPHNQDQKRIETEQAVLSQPLELEEEEPETVGQEGTKIQGENKRFVDKNWTVPNGRPDNGTRCVQTIENVCNQRQPTQNGLHPIKAGSIENRDFPKQLGIETDNSAGETDANQVLKFAEMMDHNQPNGSCGVQSSSHHATSHSDETDEASPSDKSYQGRNLPNSNTVKDCDHRDSAEAPKEGFATKQQASKTEMKEPNAPKFYGRGSVEEPRTQAVGQEPSQRRAAQGPGTSTNGTKDNSDGSPDFSGDYKPENNTGMGNLMTASSPAPEATLDPRQGRRTSGDPRRKNSPTEDRKSSLSPPQWVSAVRRSSCGDIGNRFQPNLVFVKGTEDSTQGETVARRHCNTENLSTFAGGKLKKPSPTSTKIEEQGDQESTGQDDEKNAPLMDQENRIWQNNLALVDSLSPERRRVGPLSGPGPQGQENSATHGSAQMKKKLVSEGLVGVPLSSPNGNKSDRMIKVKEAPEDTFGGATVVGCSHSRDPGSRRHSENPALSRILPKLSEPVRDVKGRYSTSGMNSLEPDFARAEPSYNGETPGKYERRKSFLPDLQNTCQRKQSWTNIHKHEEMSMPLKTDSDDAPQHVQTSRHPLRERPKGSGAHSNEGDAINETIQEISVLPAPTPTYGSCTVIQRGSKAT